jgi:hypothetical protein
MRKAKLLSVLGFLGLGAAVPSCSHDCTDAGCASGMNAHFTVPLFNDDIRASTLSICRNNDCLTGSFSSLPPDSGANVGIAFANGSVTSRTAWGTAILRPSGEIEVTYQVSDSRDLHDGDLYRVTVTDASGTPHTAIEKNVTYAVNFPNGEDCGPTCRNIELDGSAPSD